MKSSSSAAKQAAPTNEPEGIDGPAIVTPLHVQNREVSKVAGAQKGWRKLSSVELAYEQGKLGDKDSDLARSRRDAGLAYADLFDKAQGSTTDSTQALNGSRSSAGGIGISITQIDAFKQIGLIKGMLGARDSIIVAKFCGEGMFPSEAIRIAGCDKETRVSGKIRDVMDDLAIALSSLRRPKRVGGGL